MLKVNSCQFNYQYGNQIHFPYSIACLVSYLKQFDWVNENYQFEKTFVFRDKLDEYVEQCRDADVLLCSCYVWNWEITNELARRVKTINKKCLIIFGGPQIPDNPSYDFFLKYNYIDVCVHNEGELILKNIFETILDTKSNLVLGQRIRNIKGVSTFVGTTPKEERIADLSILPSPYLTDEVWNLVEQSDEIKWVSSWETNRGCPYQCTFCDWGSATYTKLRKYPVERLLREIQWFADNKIIYIDCCDANFGILARDLDLAREMKRQALQKEYPKTFRQSWAKMSSEKIIPIAQELKDGGLLTAVGLAVESLDEHTLDVIKRKNIKFDKFSNLTQEFKNNNLPTYTEIIRSLPGETLESFKRNLEELVANSEIGSIYIYNCCVLPNAPLNDPDYRELHKIETVKSPIYLAHSSINNRGIKEYEEIVSQTATAPHGHVRQMFLYSWLILTFQNLGLLEYVSKFFNKKYNISYMDFYDCFIDYCKTQDGLFRKEFNLANEYIGAGYNGKGWDHYDKELGPIFWPIEEASWLRITNASGEYVREIKSFIKFISDQKNLNLKYNLIDNLAYFQTLNITCREPNSYESLEDFIEWDFNYNILEFLKDEEDLKEHKKTYLIKNKSPNIYDSFEWNKNVIWYGRRKQIYKNSLEEVEVVL